MFAAPSELLVAEPLSTASQRLLGSYTSAARRLRSESVPAEKFRCEEALQGLRSFYAEGEARPGPDSVFAGVEAQMCRTLDAAGQSAVCGMVPRLEAEEELPWVMCRQQAWPA